MVKGTANFREIQRWFTESKTMDGVSLLDIPVDVICEDDPNNIEFFDIIGLHSSGDEFSIRVRKHK